MDFEGWLFMKKVYKNSNQPVPEIPGQGIY